MNLPITSSKFEVIYKICAIVFLLNVFITSLLVAGEDIACSGDADCSVVNGSVCSDAGMCSCPEMKPIYLKVSEKAYCLESFNLTEGNCSYNEQCNYEHGVCVGDICTCAESFVVGKDETCVPMEKNIIVPIAVGCVIGGSLIFTLFIYVCMSKRDSRKNVIK